MKKNNSKDEFPKYIIIWISGFFMGALVFGLVILPLVIDGQVEQTRINTTNHILGSIINQTIYCNDTYSIVGMGWRYDLVWAGCLTQLNKTGGTK